MSFEIYCTKDATLLYMYLSLCYCRLMVVVLSWLEGFYFSVCAASQTILESLQGKRLDFNPNATVTKSA